MKHFINFFFFWIDAAAMYETIRNDELREKSTIMGKRSIIYVVSGLIVALLSVWGLLASLNALNEDGMIVILAILGIVVCVGGAIGSVLSGLLRGLMYWIFQIKLNKQPIGKVAMVLWILSLLVAIVGSVLIMTNL